MRQFGLAAALILLTPVLRAQTTPAAAADTTKLADDFVLATMDRFPEAATYFGHPAARHDRIFDNSPAAKRAWDQRIDALQARLRAIDRPAVANRPELVTYGFLEQAIGAEVDRRVCRAELWSVDQMNGWQVSLPVYLQRQPITTDAERRAALERLRQYPKFLDQEIAQLRAGLVARYSAPRLVVDRVTAQLDALLASEPAKSPLLGAAAGSDDVAFRSAAVAVMTNEILPAARRYRSFLGEYATAARTSIAVAALPDGAACYRALARDSTSLDLSPDEIHQLGLTVMNGIHDEVRALGQRSFGTADAIALLNRVRTDAPFRFKSADEIMTLERAALARALAAMPKYFGRLPKQDVIIEAFKDFEAPSMPPAQYRSGSLDGSKPGTFMVNLYQPQETLRADAEAIAFHEAIPGHHLQIALAFEQPSAHAIAQLFGSTAFIEGWGLYSERLADEMGLYSDDLSRLGMLSAAAWRAARLVVDTGLHAKGWTREQAVDYMRKNTAVGEKAIQTEVDRYIIMPGQALAYMIGAREIQALRAKAQSTLGSRFDIRAFHDAVLGRGAVTLPTLRAQIDAWIAGQ
jgi:uncharacterized protein (DUF885 family)